MLCNFDRVLTGFNSANEWLTWFEFPSLTQFKRNRYSSKTLTVLFDTALCISETLCWLIAYCVRLRIEDNGYKNLDILVLIQL